jgi:hypothetical protein
VIGELLGIPEAHRPACVAWSGAVARSLDARPADPRGPIECLTFSAEPVLPPGVLTPGYALRLT